MANIATELGIVIPLRPEGGVAPVWALQAVGAVLPAYVQARWEYIGMTLLLAVILALAVMIIFEQLSSEEASADLVENNGELTAMVNKPVTTTLPFVMLLIVTGVLLTLGPEFVYLRDNFGVRLNTIFKFYYQAWVLYGTAAIFGIFYLWRIMASRVQKVVPAVVTAGYALIFIMSLMFPFYAIQSRSEEFRGPAEATFRQPLTLNGLAQMQHLNPDEYAAITWLRENVEGTPVILESVGGQYSNFGRVSASTGLPTLLGWAGHQYQWRGSATNEPAVREPSVADIYTAPAWEGSNASLLLDDYGVELIYVGGLEQSSYAQGGNTSGLDKFAERLEVAYQNTSVIIYRWLPAQQ